MNPTHSESLVTRDDKFKMIQIVGHLLICDGFLTDEESAYMSGLMDDLGLEDHERREVLAGINVDIPVEDKAANLPKEALTQLLGWLQQAADSDGSLAPNERDVIDAVQRRLDTLS